MRDQRKTSDPEAMMAEAAEALGQDLGADCAGFFQLADQDTLEFGPSWSGGTLTPFAMRWPAGNIGAGYLRRLRTGQAFAIADTARDSDATGLGLGSAGVRAIIMAPVIRDERWAAGLYVHHSVSREWDADEIAFVQDVAEITWDAVEQSRTAAAIRETETLFREIAGVVPVLIWMSDRTKACVWFNKPWLDFTGRTMEQELGYGWAEGVHPGDFDRCVATYNEAFDQREPFRMDYRLRRNDGVYRMVNDIGVQRFSSDGKFLGYIGSCLDVTDQRAAAEALRVSEERFRGIFEYAATGIAIGDMEGRLQSGNPAYCSMLGYTKEELRKLSIGDIMHPEDLAECMSNLDRLVAQEIPSYETLNRYLAKDGKPVWVHKHVSLLRDDKGTPVNAMALVTDVTDRRRAEEAVRGSELRYRQLVEQMSDAIFVADSQGRFVETSAVGCAMLGMTRDEVLSSRLTDIIIPEEHHRIAPEMVRFDDGGIYTSEWQVRRKDGSVFLGEVVARKLANGNLQGVVRDISERKRHDDQIRLLMREVNHRSKNMLALVQAIARQTLAVNPDDFLDRFGKRVEALAANQDLLVKNAWKGVDLNDLVRSQLAPFSDLIGTKIELEGPTLTVSASAAQVLGMALHELATNAGKYGALSGANGLVDISWRLKPGQRSQEVFVMSWRERCAHSITAPSRLGFGSSVIGSMAEMNLGAQVELDYPSTGLTWQLSCAAGEVVEGGSAPNIASEEGAASSKRRTVSGDERTNHRPCVLVVEDEALVAMEIAHALTEAGFDVAGPARNVPTALELLKRHGCDAAVLDINLGRETSEAIAIQLTANKTPFVILSGHSSEQHHPVFDSAPALRKPLRLQFLVAEIKKCVGQKHGGPVDRTSAYAK